MMGPDNSIARKEPPLPEAEAPRPLGAGKEPAIDRRSMDEESLRGVPLRDLEQIVSLVSQAIEQGKTPVLLTHGNPDPDALASVMCLKMWIKEMSGLDAQIYFNGTLPKSLQSFGVEGGSLEQFKDHVAELGDDAFVILADASSPGMPHVRGTFHPEAMPVPDLTLDHHQGEVVGKHAFIYPDPAAAGCTAAITVAAMEMWCRENGRSLPEGPEWTKLYTLVCGAIATDNGIQVGVDVPDLRVPRATRENYQYFLHKSDRELLKTLDVTENMPSYRGAADFAREHLQERCIGGIYFAVTSVGKLTSETDEKAVVALVAEELLKDDHDVVVVMADFPGVLSASIRTTGTTRAGEMAKLIFGNDFAGGREVAAGARIETGKDSPFAPPAGSDGVSVERIEGVLGLLEMKKDQF